MSPAFLERWLEEVVATPGMTGITDPEVARGVLLDDALRALPLLEGRAGPVVDVGSGGGSPGLPLASVLPGHSFTLLEADRRKCDFLERSMRGLSNARVVWGRAEEHELEAYGVALAKALAKPTVAAELCLPLVRQDGVAILWVGETAEREAVARAAAQLGGHLEADHEGLLVLEKDGPTPPGFPRRPGMAKKRPLA